MKQKLYILFAIGLLSACNGEPQAGQTASAVSEVTRPVELTAKENGFDLNWKTLRQAAGLTPDESGIFSGRGEIASLVKKEMEKMNLNIADYPTGYILREEAGIYYTGGFNNEAEPPNEVFYILIDPVKQSVSACALRDVPVTDAKTQTILYCSKQGVEVPSDVVMALDSIIQRRNAISGKDIPK
mgnify:CR=1 FL=1